MDRITYISDFKKWKEGFIFFHPIKVRFSETDLFGHLNNTVPFIYFEEARIEYLKKQGLMQNWLEDSSEKIPVVADLQCDFTSQVYFGEQIKLYVKVESIGTSSIDIHYLGLNENDKACFVGRGTLVQISKQTGKGVPWTEKMREQLLV